LQSPVAFSDSHPNISHTAEPQSTAAHDLRYGYQSRRDQISISASERDRWIYIGRGKRVRRPRRQYFALRFPSAAPLFDGGATPVDAVYAYSTLGTTISVQEGTVAAFL
jgi:hypothetical protein